jgi:large subunit ribosomal protein LP2
MRHIAAYLLLQSGGNADPSAADIKKLLSVAGVEADESRLKTLISELKGKSISDVRFCFFCKRLLVMVEI